MTITSPPRTTLAPGTRTGVRVLGWILLGVGVLVAAFVAYLAWGQLHPDLDRVPFGTTVVLEQHGATQGAIFATDGTTPTCTVDGEPRTSPAGDVVVVDGMRMVQTFSVAWLFNPQDVRYTVVCNAESAGEYAVTQYEPGFGLVALFSVPAALLLGAGALLLYLGRRPRLSSEATTEPSTS